MCGEDGQDFAFGFILTIFSILKFIYEWREMEVILNGSDYFWDDLKWSVLCGCKTNHTGYLLVIGFSFLFSVLRRWLGVFPPKTYIEHIYR